MKKILIPLSILSLFIITGCTGEQKKNPQITNENNSTNTSIVVKAPDLCEVLTAKMVSDALGYEVTSNHKTLPQTETTTGCDYESVDVSKGFGVTIIANYGNNLMNAKAGYEQAVNYQKDENSSLVNVKDLQGVGDMAVTTEAQFMTSIQAVKGNVWVTASRAGKPGPQSTELVKKVVNKTFEVL